MEAVSVHMMGNYFRQPVVLCCCSVGFNVVVATGDLLAVAPQINISKKL